MAIVLDLVVVAIVLLFVLLGIRKGFARSLVEVVGSVLAVVIAFVLSAPIAGFIYSNFIEKNVEQQVEAAVYETVDGGINGAIDSVWDANPTLSKLTSLYGFDKEEIKGNATNFTQEGQQEVSQYLIQQVIEPAAVMVIRVLTGIVLALVLLFAVRILAKLVGGVFSIPIIGGLNKALGGILGLVKGLLIATLICVLLNLLISFSANGFAGATQQTVQQSFLFKNMAGVVELEKATFLG